MEAARLLTPLRSLAADPRAMQTGRRATKGGGDRSGCQGRCREGAAPQAC